MSLPIAVINQAIADAVPDRPALIFGDKRWSFGDIDARTNRLADVLLAHGLSVHQERAQLENWECGQDRVALYLLNGNEYLEGMLAAFKARAVPFNVNYRYVAEELVYLLRDAGAKAVIYHAQFAPLLAEVLAQLPTMTLLLQVDDDSGNALLPGALDYEPALRQAAAGAPGLAYRPDDIYLLYTGGTTGFPKGVLWRQADNVVAQLGGRRGNGSVLQRIDDFVARARRSPGHRVMPTSPFMHGAGSYVAFNAWHCGNSVVIQENVAHLDPADVLATIERERVNMFLLIGDAFGRPLVAEAERGDYDLVCVNTIYNTGAILSPAVKQGLMRAMPNARIIDALGASETGPQATVVSAAGGEASPRFRLSDESVVLSEDRRTLLPPGHDGLGWLAKRGSVPLGYLGDRAKTAETFPVIDGVRYVVGGDRVCLLADGEIDYRGRESFTINSGGEKIFVEEVEQAVKHHPAVADVVVTSRASQRWGNEVVAIVQLIDGFEANRESLLEECARHIARYKLPKAFLFVPAVHRGANGKADYQWAKAMAGRAT